MTGRLPEITSVTFEGVRRKIPWRASDCARRFVLVKIVPAPCWKWADLRRPYAHDHPGLWIYILCCSPVRSDSSCSTNFRADQSTAVRSARDGEARAAYAYQAV